jgi:serine/threonine protein kinase
VSVLPDPSSATAAKGGLACLPPLPLAAHNSNHPDAPSFECALPAGDPDASGDDLTDDTPTIPLMRGQQQLAATRQGVDMAPGTVLRSRYVLQDIIGRGGTSIIFRVIDLHRTSPQDMAAEFLAVKVLCTERRDDPSALTRLKREFRQMQRLSHPGIVRVFDLDCDGDVWFISMEFVAGRTVKTWMRTPASYGEALRIIGACCGALEHAHSLGILHGDLKPTNVLVGDNGAVKLIDFGAAPGPGGHVAAASDPALAVTPLYASPQILAGNTADCRDDVYSLACLSYSILSGGLHPFGGRPSFEGNRAKSAPTYVRAIPKALFKVIERSLSAERERRPASAAEFLCEMIDAERSRRVADRMSKSALPALLREVRPGAGSLTIANAPGIGPPVADRVVRSRGSDRGASNFAGLVAAFLAVVGGAAWLPLDGHRDLMPNAQLPPEASAKFPELISTASAQADVVPAATSSPHNSGVITFEALTVHASAAQSLVAISVKRLQGIASRGTFVWRVERGTAYPGVDYKRMEPQVVRFTEGQAVRTLFIPLINTGTALLQRGPRTFTVALEQVAGGPALGRIARLTVAIDPPPTSSRFAAYQARAEE